MQTNNLSNVHMSASQCFPCWCAHWNPERTRELFQRKLGTPRKITVEDFVRACVHCVDRSARGCNSCYRSMRRLCNNAEVHSHTHLIQYTACLTSMSRARRKKRKERVTQAKRRALIFLVRPSPCFSRNSSTTAAARSSKKIQLASHKIVIFIVIEE